MRTELQGWLSQAPGTQEWEFLSCVSGYSVGLLSLLVLFHVDVVFCSECVSLRKRSFLFPSFPAVAFAVQRMRFRMLTELNLLNSSLDVAL